MYVIEEQETIPRNPAPQWIRVPETLKLEVICVINFNVIYKKV